jgi:hypothetical protein
MADRLQRKKNTKPFKINKFVDYCLENRWRLALAFNACKEGWVVGDDNSHKTFFLKTSFDDENFHALEEISF